MSIIYYDNILNSGNDSIFKPSIMGIHIDSWHFLIDLPNRLGHFLGPWMIFKFTPFFFLLIESFFIILNHPKT